MNRTLLLLAALTLPAALAQTAAPAPAPSTTVPLAGQVPSAVKDAWKAFAAAGGQASLLDATGAVIGTLNADGTVTLQGPHTLSDVKAVRLQPKAGAATTVNVTRDLSRPGAVKIEWMGPGGRRQSLPLPAVAGRLNRVADAAPATARPETDDDDRAEGPDHEKAKGDDKGSAAKGHDDQGKSGEGHGKGKGKN